MSNVLVFGKTGQVAQELQAKGNVICFGREATDLANPEACASIIHAHAPAAVINAAAYTDVDRAEKEEAQAAKVNAEAPGAMARACAEIGIPFLHVSTDYVFDGSGEAPWQPCDTPAPINAYGRSKMAGEAAVREAGGQAAILRTSWVFSSHGSNFVRTMLRLSEFRDAISIVDDQIGGPTPAAAIARALLAMCNKMIAGHAGGTWHIAGHPYVSWAELARWIFRFAGRNVTVTPIPSADYTTPALRPLNSRLDCTTLLRDFGLVQPDWKADLRADVRRLMQ